MSEQKTAGILQQLKQQHAQFCQQRDQAQVNFQQLSGAIYACEMMIKKHEDVLKETVEELANKVKNAASQSVQSDINQGVINDGKVNDKSAKQTA